MYGLIGYPLGHSFSAKFFNDKFLQEGINEHYELFQIPEIGMLNDIISQHPDLKGINVTIPYKEQVVPYLTDISDDAKEIGAVNVIRIGNGGKTLEGFNTDAIGFRDSITPLLKPHMNKALVLGTGGASRAVSYVLKDLGLEVTKVSRSHSLSTITYDMLDDNIMSSHHIIVNTTPLGTWPNIDNCPSIPYNLLTPRHLCYDLVYNPEKTKFLTKASANGAVVKNGLEMLHRQAIAAWEIWNS